MDVQDLGRRAVACDGWRWMPGMLDEGGDRCLRVETRQLGHYDAIFVASTGDPEGEFCLESDRESPCIPDLSDPATLGAGLFGLLPAAGVSLSTEGCPDGQFMGWYRVGDDPIDDVRPFSGWPLGAAEALVAALEAAPKEVK